MKYCTLPVVTALLAGRVLAQSELPIPTVTASSVIPTTTITASSITIVPTTTPTASSVPASTIVPTTTPTAVPTSTIIPTTTPTAVPTSTIVPTTTPTAVPTSTIVPTTTVTASSVPVSSTAVPVPPAIPTAVTASFDPVYDNGNNSLDIVACSNTQSLTTATGGKRTFGALPSFPHIGGAFAVTGFGSAGCGTCWAVTFENKTINVLAIDVAIASFNVAQATLDELTGGRAVQLGRVNVTAVQVDASGCGL